MPTTAFSARKNGFHFPNSFVNEVFDMDMPWGHVNVETSGRCGGMAYAALDYFFAGVPVPTHEARDFAPAEVPPDGNGLADYLYHRLFDSFATLSALQFVDWTLRPDQDISVYGVPVETGVISLTEAQIPTLKAAIDSGKPVVLGLVKTRWDLTALGEDHQIVAYGYEGNADAIAVYDNREPDAEGTLTRNPDMSWHLSAGHLEEDWRGWFVQDYARQTPRYHDLVLASGVTPSSPSVAIGGAFSCEFTAENPTDFPAHLSQYFLYIRGPQNEVLDDLLSGDLSGTDLPPGAVHKVVRATTSFGGRAGRYRLSAGFISAGGSYETVPAITPGTATEASVTAVSVTPPPPQPRLDTSVDPYPLPIGAPVALTVGAHDHQSGGDVSGRVLVDWADAGPTNAQFTWTFRYRRVIRRTPDGVEVALVAPVVRVAAAGYPRTLVDCGFEPLGEELRTSVPLLERGAIRQEPRPRPRQAATRQAARARDEAARPAVFEGRARLDERGYSALAHEAREQRRSEQSATDALTKQDTVATESPTRSGAPRDLPIRRQLPIDGGDGGTGGGQAGTRTLESWLYYDVHTSTTACWYFSLDAFPQCDQLATPASTMSGRGAQIVELRGWLRSVDSSPNLADNPADWHYDLELDPAWAAKLGVDVNQIMRPGSVLLHNRMQTGDSFGQIRNVVASPNDSDKVAVSPALLHAELMSWRPGQTLAEWEGLSRPVETPTGWTHVEPQDGRGITWPWDPRLPSNGDQVPLRVGDYVRMVGALVTDTPHGLGGRSWAESSQTNANPARWTEMHPPDVIERVLPARAHESTLCCAAVFASNGLLSGDTTSLEFDLFPVDPRPDPLATLQCDEHIDNAFTNFRRIVGQNPGQGAHIEQRGDHVHISVAVAGESAYGAPGKYKAWHALRWIPGPPQVRATIQPPSGSTRAGDGTSLTVSAMDWRTSQALSSASVSIDRDPTAYPANSQFAYTFHGSSHRVHVEAPGYVAADVNYLVALRELVVTVVPSPVPLGQPVSVTVHATDAITGQAVKAEVYVDGSHVGATDVPFTATFRRKRVPQVDPESGVRTWTWVYPTGEVRVGSPDYADASIDFGWPDVE